MYRKTNKKMEQGIPKLSLCIPTLDRFDTFLSKNLPDYLSNRYIDEIVISDENGNDIKKIRQHFPDNKLKLYSNDKVLGAYLNKEKVVSLASNTWVVLLDSDNYAPIEYYIAFERYVMEHGLHPNTIYMPAGWLKSNRNYYNQYGDIDFTIQNAKHYFDDCMWNTGNYIVNKNTYLHVKNNYEYLIPCCYSLDVIYKNAILLENNVHFRLVKDMLYDHVVHDGSYYIHTSHQAEPFRKTIYSIYFQ